MHTIELGMSPQEWLLTLFGRHSRLAIDAVPGIHHDFFQSEERGRVRFRFEMTPSVCL